MIDWLMNRLTDWPTDWLTDSFIRSVDLINQFNLFIYLIFTHPFHNLYYLFQNADV